MTCLILVIDGSLDCVVVTCDGTEPADDTNPGERIVVGDSMGSDPQKRTSGWCFLRINAGLGQVDAIRLALVRLK